MNIRTKRFAAVAFILLALLHSLSAAVQTPVPKAGKVFTDFGVESEMRMPSEVMRLTFMDERLRGMRVPEIRQSPLLFKHAGGIMFDLPAKPCAGLAKARLSLGYDRRRPDGQRLILRVGLRDYTVPGVYDRDLRPIAEFANDDSMSILTNVQYPDELEDSCPPPGNLKIVTLHPAVLNTNLGRLLTSIDSVPWSFSRGKRWQMTGSLPAAALGLSKSLSGALTEDEKAYETMYAQARSRFINRGESILHQLSLEERKMYVRVIELNNRAHFDWESYEKEILAEPGIDKLVWNRLSVEDRRILLLIVQLETHRVSNFNDEGAPPSFCARGSSVTLGGSPHLEFIAPWYSGNHVLPKSSQLMTENLSQLRLVEPEAYDGMLEVYRLAGLFRYVKQQSPLAWGRFLKSLPPKERLDTYTIVCPDCKKAEVEMWLDCVDKNVHSSD